MDETVTIELDDAEPAGVLIGAMGMLAEFGGVDAGEQADLEGAIGAVLLVVTAALAQDARGDQSSPRLRSACVAYRAWKPKAAQS